MICWSGPSLLLAPCSRQLLVRSSFLNRKIGSQLHCPTTGARSRDSQHEWIFHSVFVALSDENPGECHSPSDSEGPFGGHSWAIPAPFRGHSRPFSGHSRPFGGHSESFGAHSRVIQRSFERQKWLCSLPAPGRADVPADCSMQSYLAARHIGRRVWGLPMRRSKAG